MAPILSDDAWLARFHAGDRVTLDAFYRDQFSTVEGALAHLRGADRETVVFEVFLRIWSDADLRRSLSNASLGDWLVAITRTQATDFLRRTGRAETLPPTPTDAPEARGRIERFRAEVLPKAWEPVFERRFVGRLDPVDVARELGVSRTTLAYRELRIRALLRSFILQSEDP